MNAALREFRVALMLLSRLPAGRIEGAAPNLADARWAFPLVGLALGLIGWAVHAGALASGAPAPVAAVRALAALALATGALHFDGLADFADGIGGGRDRAHALEIMRDSRVGSYGVLALILIVALWLAALGELSSLEARRELRWWAGDPQFGLDALQAQARSESGREWIREQIVARGDQAPDQVLRRMLIVLVHAGEEAFLRDWAAQPSSPRPLKTEVLAWLGD